LHDSILATGALVPGVYATILFVDGEESLGLVAAEFLLELGYQVLLAGEGAQALKVLEKYSDSIDLIVLDLMMPKMSGEEVLEAVKRDYPSIPVVVASGYAKVSLEKNLVNQGYDGFLEKPYNFDHFSRIIDGLLKS